MPCVQLGIHRRPVGFLNTRGFYTRLMDFWRHAAEEGFISEQHLDIAVVDDNPVALLTRVLASTPPDGYIAEEVWARAAQAPSRL